MNKAIAKDIFFSAFVLVLSFLFLLLTSCKHEPVIKPIDESLNTNTGGGNNSSCNSDTVYFNQVQPILTAYCTGNGCHNAADHEGDVILTDYNQIIATGDIDPGRPNNSDLYEVLIETNPDDRMPMDQPPLSSSQIDLIYTWISQGAQNNFCENSCDTTNVTYSGAISSIISNSCLGCHRGSSAGGGIQLDSYLGVKQIADNGRLIGSINHLSNYQPMPRNAAKLDDCKLNQIRIWINNGAQNN